MKRVCCFVERWESGGIESFLCNVLTRLDLTRLEVDVVTASLGDSIFTKQLQEHGVCFFELSGSQRNIPENHRRFRKLARERHWDVLHLNAFHGLSLAYLHIAQQEGITSRFAHAHGAGLRKSLTRSLKLAIHYWGQKRYTADATDLWACSQSAAKFLFDGQVLKEQGYQFIPNGIDVERFCFDPVIRKVVRTELKVEDRFLVGNVGRLCYEKNQSFLLDVFAELQKEIPKCCLLLVGNGPEKEKLRTKAQKIGIADKVIFYGTTDHVERLLWAMDVFAFPSLFEGLGIAALEAQAAGLPVVCSEYVPEEVYITQSVCSIPLAAGPAAWVEQLIGSQGARVDGAEAVKDAGFDISHTTKQIERYFKTESWDCHDKRTNTVV